MTENIVIDVEVGGNRLSLSSEKFLNICPTLKTLDEFVLYLKKPEGSWVKFFEEYKFEEKSCEIFEEYINHGLVFIYASSRYKIKYSCNIILDFFTICRYFRIVLSLELVFCMLSLLDLKNASTSDISKLVDTIEKTAWDEKKKGEIQKFINVLKNG